MSYPAADTTPASRSPLTPFFAALAILVLLRLGAGLLSLPTGVLPVATVAFTVVFIALPVYAVFQASRYAWTGIAAAGFIVAGVLMQVGGSVVSAQVFHGQGFGASMLTSLAQAGLIMWTTGLGAAITLMIKDRNLLIPISIFLAGLDVFLVFAPVGPTRMIMAAAPQALPSVALQIPAAQQAATGGPVRPFAFVGPADLLFMAMFFVALHRFGLRAVETARWLVGAILVYLLLAAFVPALPLLLPIGLCVLAVNAREFKLSKEEWASTAVIGVVAVGLAVAAFAMPRPSEPPSISDLSPEQQELATHPAQAPPAEVKH